LTVYAVTFLSYRHVCVFYELEPIDPLHYFYTLVRRYLLDISLIRSVPCGYQSNDVCQRIPKTISKILAASKDLFQVGRHTESEWVRNERNEYLDAFEPKFIQQVRLWHRICQSPALINETRSTSSMKRGIGIT